MTNLRYITVKDISPMCRAICNDCQWILDHGRQKVGLKATEEKWLVYKKAIRAIDKKQPMILMNIDIIEVTDIQDETYKHLLHELTKPIKISENQNISAGIEFLMSTGKASVVSSPRIMGQSGKEAVIKIGDKIPYSTFSQSTSSTIQNVQYVDSGIELLVTPYVHYSNMIDLSIELNYSIVNGFKLNGQSEIPLFASRKTKLNIQLPSNTTVLFAGLIDTSEHRSIEQVPLLGDLPWIGHLFRRVGFKKKSVDLIYKLTPKIMN